MIEDSMFYWLRYTHTREIKDSLAPKGYYWFINTDDNELNKWNLKFFDKIREVLEIDIIYSIPAYDMFGNELSPPFTAVNIAYLDKDKYENFIEYLHSFPEYYKLDYYKVLEDYKNSLE